MPPKDKYTDPKLRNEVKEEIQKGDKGGAPGQWSARKAQMMASEYKKRGGDYNTHKSEKDESQKNLTKWGEEDWQTKDGSGNAKQEDGSEKRYLPKKAWDKMSEQEKTETDDKKQKESKQGKQHVANTTKAKNSRKQAAEEDEEEHNDQENEGGNNGVDAPKNSNNGTRKSSRKQQGQQSKSRKSSAQKEDDEDSQDDQQEDIEDEKPEEDDQKSQPGQKRGRKQSSGASKKQKPSDEQPKKTIGSKHMDATEPGKKGSADRLPKKGQTVHWKAMPGYVDGKLEEVLKKDKQVNGKSVKASEKDPRLVLKSNSSGKICVHKPEACFYD